MNPATIIVDGWAVCEIWCHATQKALESYTQLQVINYRPSNSWSISNNCNLLIRQEEFFYWLFKFGKPTVEFPIAVTLQIIAGFIALVVNFRSIFVQLMIITKKWFVFVRDYYSLILSDMFPNNCKVSI